MSEEALKLLAEREKRINDAIALRKPDRVPVWHGVPGRYPAERLGITPRRADDGRRASRWRPTSRRRSTTSRTWWSSCRPSGRRSTPLGYRHLKWAGHGLAGGLRLAVRGRRGDEARGVRRAHLRPVGLHRAQVLAAGLQQAGRAGGADAAARGPGLLRRAVRLRRLRHAGRAGGAGRAARSRRRRRSRP